MIVHEIEVHEVFTSSAVKSMASYHAALNDVTLLRGSLSAVGQCSHSSNDPFVPACSDAAREADIHSGIPIQS